jgi:hypothetical protein
MARSASLRIDWPSVVRDYSFENDVIARLWHQRARIEDVDIPARYGEEVSGIRLQGTVPDLLRTLHRAFWRRFWWHYVVRSFSPVALFAAIAFVLLIWSLLFGIWVVYESVGPPQASTATVMLVVLPFLTGLQLALAALVLDIVNSPS